MKKNRPAYRLTVVCNEEKMGLLQKVIFTQTTTIGIRYRKEQRTVLKRQIKEIETPLGKLQVKEVEIDGEKRCYPEYESAKKLALKHHCSSEKYIILLNKGEFMTSQLNKIADYWNQRSFGYSLDNQEELFT